MSLKQQIIHIHVPMWNTHPQWYCHCLTESWKVQASFHDKGWIYFVYALYAFAGLGIEVLLAFFFEPLIYGCSMNKWSTIQNISHWVITCVCWGVMCCFLIKTAKSKYNLDVFEQHKKMKKWQWCVIVAIFVLMLVSSYIDWNGSKVLKELQYNGWLKFIFQYI